MNHSLTCLSCGVEIPSESPLGQCPKCLLHAGLDSQPAPAAKLQATLPSPQANSGFSPPSGEALAKLFPQLEILELLGKGGMGVVYKARQKGLDRLVAVKILPPEIGRDPAFAERFMREARALAKLSHPNIVAVHDFGDVAGQFYFLMEYVDGVNLRQAIRGGQVTPQEALAIVPQVCDALQFAHDEGIVHRDIKPENILLDKKGRVKIADFGLAKLLGSEPLEHHLTATHQVMGTLRYMAPEQMEGSKSVDHRADIYSLGVVFYELLTGEVPMGHFAPPSKKVQIDVRLDEVVLRALQKEPEQRYQQASQVRDDLRDVASDARESAGDVDNVKPGPSSPRSALRQGLEAPAAALFFAGLLMVVMGLVIVFWFGATLASYALAPANSSQNGMTVTVTNTITIYHWMAFVSQFLAAGAGMVIMLASSALRRLESRKLAQAGCYLAMLPISPAWIFALPAGVWALLTLHRPKIIRLFADAEQQEHRDWHEEASLWQAHLGKFGIVAAIIALIGTFTTFLPWASISFFGIRIVTFGHQGWPGISTGLLFLAVLLMAIVTGYFRLPRIYLRLSMLAAGLTVVLIIGNLFMHAGMPVITQSPVSVNGDMSSADAEAMIKPLLNGFLSGLSDGTMFGIWMALTAGLALSIVGCIPIFKPRLETDDAESKPRLSRLALAGAIWIPAVWLLWIGIFVAVVVYTEMHRHERNWHTFLDIGVAIGSVLATLIGGIGAMLLGAIAFKQIQCSHGKLYGLRLAFTEVILFPLLALAAVIFYIANLIGFGVIRSLQTPGDGDVGVPTSGLFILYGLISLTVCYYAVRATWRWATMETSSK